MTLNASIGRRLLRAGTIAATFAAWPAVAQQPVPQPAAPAAAAPTGPAAAPPWAQGRPEAAIGVPLAPIAPPPIPTAADKLPIEKLKAPKGFKIELYAAGVGNARTLRQGDKGTVFVGSRLLDKVYAIVDKGEKREVKPIYSGLYRPNGLAFKDGVLYIAELSRISKVEKIEDNLDNPPKPVVIYDDLPKDEAHGWKFLTIGPDDKLYFQVGAPCNICMPSPAHAQIRRINLDGSGAEVVARGIRQIVGMDFSPITKQLYFTENSRDWLSEDIPEESSIGSPSPARTTSATRIATRATLRIRNSGGVTRATSSPSRYALLGPAYGRRSGCGSIPGIRSRLSIATRSSSRATAPESNQEDRRGYCCGKTQRRRCSEVDRAVHHWLHREQQLCCAPGRRGVRERRVDADFR